MGKDIDYSMQTYWQIFFLLTDHLIDVDFFEMALPFLFVVSENSSTLNKDRQSISLHWELQQHRASPEGSLCFHWEE